MSDFRAFSFLHDGDYFSHGKHIYRVNWALDGDNNSVKVKTNEECFISNHEKVKWLRNYNKICVLK